MNIYKIYLKFLNTLKLDYMIQEILISFLQEKYYKWVLQQDLLQGKRMDERESQLEKYFQEKRRGLTRYIKMI